MSHNNRFFAARFTVISLVILTLITVSLSLIFFINFQTLSYKKIEITLGENVTRLRDTMIAKFNEWSALVRYAALGAAPFMAQEPPNIQIIENLFRHTMDVQLDVRLMYCTNNLVWNEPGGYVLSYPNFIPPDDWNNTRRSWFVGAKAHPGEITYTDPYVDIVTKTLITSVVTNVYDKSGRDVGVLAADIEIDFLGTMLQSNVFLPRQQIFLINEQGLFIAESDTDREMFITKPGRESVLQRDFFIDRQLEPYRQDILSSPSFFKMDSHLFIYSVSIPNVDWILVSLVPTSVIFTGMNRSLIQILCLNFAFILIAVFMSLILTRVLQRERDENTAMKDNLNIGFFLMDRNYTIQEHYSRALEHLFATGSLRGKNFIGLLSASMRDNDIATLKDYFDMVFNQAFDQDLLNEINPIHELSYTGVETGEEKILGCGFKAVSRGTKDVFILGNIRDITAEKTLRIRLEEEETKRQEEMHFLFEVVQGDLQVLKDFIEDMDYEFDHIDAALEDKRLTPRELLVNWYQSIHAIKSNAVILGLKTFGEKFHLLESEIKPVLEQEAILEEDLEGIIEGVEGLKQEQKKLISVIHKIQSFKADKKGSQGEYVLVESLTRACNKVAADMDKQVQLVVKHIDPESIERGPRRVMKEVLLQLIRNAIYHGIEGKEERRALGKDETGIITLSIEMEEGKIQIWMGDDGKGIDFERIRVKAERLQLVEAGEVERERLIEVIFAPGFSTAEEEGVHAGRGIGLNLVRDRIEEIGGSIGVRSEQGKGTMFTIIIPPTEEEAAAHQAS